MRRADKLSKGLIRLDRALEVHNPKVHHATYHLAMYLFRLSAELPRNKRSLHLTYGQIGKVTGLSPHSIADSLAILEELGWLKTSLKVVKSSNLFATRMSSIRLLDSYL